jgi:hypothetical protein
MPKNRQTIFCVVRNHFDNDELLHSLCISATLTLERAEELAGKYTQEVIDRDFQDIFNFEVQTVTYYDE